MYRSRQCIVAIAIVLGVAGCSHSPQWTRTWSSSEFYYQGVGDGRSEGQAKRSAELGLCGEMQQRTISIQSIHEAQERVTNGTFQNESTFRQWIKEEFDCELPAGVRIAERARIDSRYWAYAIAERPGQEQRINQLFVGCSTVSSQGETLHDPGLGRQAVEVKMQAPDKGRRVGIWRWL